MTKLKDLQSNPEWARAVSEARDLWYAKSEEAFKVHGDTGCCTLGGGIYALVTPPRCRVPQKILIIRPPFPVQGEVALYAGLMEATNYLRVRFPEVHLVADYGRMD